jgi:23S rRNA (pseudouridine1915-N3)-methyltransferase
MKIRLVFLGRTRRPEMRGLLEDYVTRLERFTEVEILEFRDAAAFTRRKNTRASNWILLDAEGRQQTSADFARWLTRERDSGTRELSFLCGDAAGFPEEIRVLAKRKLSLSSLTLSHELARVVLAEQLYRAFATLAGHPYAK